jgi:hypothetical protein
MSERYAVVSPEGRRATDALERPAPVAVEGAVIGQLWDMAFRGDLIFADLREGLATRYPNVRFVDYREFGDIHGPREREVVRALPGLLRRLQCNAVIAGVGA